MAAGIEEGAVRRELFRRRKERELINRRRGHGMRTLFAAKLQRPAFRRIELRRAAGGDSDLDPRSLRNWLVLLIAIPLGDYQGELASAVNAEEIAHDVLRSGVDT